MIDYKTYQKVLGVIESVDAGTPEQRASLICELFDQKTVQSVGSFVKPPNSLNHLQTSPSLIPCGQFPRDAFGAPIPY